MADPNATNPAPSAASGTPPASTDPNAGQNTPPASGTPPANNAQNGGQNTPPANDPPPANTATPPANQNPKEPPANTKPAEQTPPANDPPPAPDILDLAKGEGQKRTEEEEKAKSAFNAYVQEAGFDHGLADIVFREGKNGAPDLKLSSNEVGAILTAVQKSGIPADKAKSMLGMVASLDALRAKAQEEADKRTLSAIRAETAKEFGDHLGAAARDMVAGGERLFGAELWADICTIPALVNDKRFIRAMSAYGRSGRNDNGGPAPASGGGASSSMRFTLDSWTKGSGNGH